jgi:GntR family transcriptional regulator, transcriptional repressor for pyruvate dehydrogenase complex
MPPTDTLPDLTPAARPSLADAVAEQLAARIVDGELRPGARLPGERDLSTRLSVSRIVVREALGRLAERGLIDVRPGVGTFVAAIDDVSVTDPLRLYLRRSRLDARHLFELRFALEPAIAAAAAREVREGRVDAATLAALAESVATTDALATAPAAAERETFARSDLRFHDLLAHASGNPLFALLLAPLIDPLLDVRRRGVTLPGARERATAGHRRVLQAVTAGDDVAADTSMRAHLHDVASWLTP